MSKRSTHVHASSHDIHPVHANIVILLILNDNINATFHNLDFVSTGLK